MLRGFCRVFERSPGRRRFVLVGNVDGVARLWWWVEGA